MTLTLEFQDGKEPEALRTIGEVAKALGIKQHVLRYWEEQFPVLAPIKRSGGRRYYRPQDVEMIATIHRLVHADGYTLRGARAAIEASATGKISCQSPAEAPVQIGANQGAADDFMEQLRTIRDDLADALAQA